MPHLLQFDGLQAVSAEQPVALGLAAFPAARRLSGRVLPQLLTRLTRNWAPGVNKIGAEKTGAWAGPAT
jgi:hypothetical protein